MPPDPVGRRERSRARPPILGARPLLAPFGRCAAPMPPDPVGRRERSRARPPILGARPLLAPFGRCAAPMPPDPVGQARRLSAPASTRVWGGRSRPPRARDNSRAAPTARGSAPLGAGLHPRLEWAFSPAARPGQLTGGSHRAGLGASRRRPPPAFGVGVLARRAPGTTHARLPRRATRRLSAQAHPPWGGYSCAGLGPGLRLGLLAQLAALLLVVAAVEDAPLAP